MTRSYGDRETEKLWRRVPSRKFQRIERAARIKLGFLDAATALTDLTLPGLRLEKLSGTRPGSIVSALTSNTGAAFVGEREILMKSKSRIATKKLPLLHPGDYLRSVLVDAGLSANAVALALRVPANRLTEILNGRRAITADTAMRLGCYFGTSAQMWMNLQTKCDLEAAEEKLAGRIQLEVQPIRQAS